MASPYLHFWLADRGDLFDPAAGTSPQLPLPQGMNPSLSGRELKGDASIVSLNTRTGLISTSTPARFDTQDVGKACYDASLPFRDAEHGIR
jgi:hypothetical protein